MARKTQARIVVKGELTAATPLHVGGYGESFDTDLPLARDGAGQLYVPGTSLAGPLRAWCFDAFDPQAARELWGWQKQGGQEDREVAGWGKEHASFVLVEDAPVLDANGESLRDDEVEIRDGVGIDRKWGAAAEQIKFDRAVLPRGARLGFQLSLDVGDDEDKAQARARLNRAKVVLGHMLEVLAVGDVPFGAAKTRGLGRVKLSVGADVRVQGRNSRAGIIEVLRGGGAASSEDELKAAGESLKAAGEPLEPQTPARLVVEIEWEPRGALMVKSGVEGVGVDVLPLVSGEGGDVALLLSGSSVKGALRAHAERIARTVGHTRFGPNGGKKFDEQIGQVGLVKELFGAGKPAKSQDEKSPGADEGGRAGALAVRDCYAKSTLTRATWKKLVTGKEGELPEELTKIAGEGRGRLAQAQHVAIDRWTGGAADAMLFSVLEPYDIAWEPLVLTLDLDPRRHAKGDGQKVWDRRDAALALLLLTLRDLVAGRVPLGFAVNRGMGDIEVKSIRFKPRGGGWPGDMKIRFDAAGGGGGRDRDLFGKLGAEALKPLEEAWGEWVKSARP